MASMGKGTSSIDYPLDSLDARSCVSVCRALGASIEEQVNAGSACPNPPNEQGGRLVRWTVTGIAGNFDASIKPDRPLDVGNSGTTLFLSLALASLGRNPVTFIGDAQIARRGALPLVEALKGLGIQVTSGADGCIPITVQGPWQGGRVRLPCPTSQYLSALLLAAPLAPAGRVTEIEAPLLNEKPYIALTLSYLDAQGIPYEAAPDFSWFRIPGGAAYSPINGPVPGDFSSAAFPACAAAVAAQGTVPAAGPDAPAPPGELILLGLDPQDLQGDKAFFDMLACMGCRVRWDQQNADALPASWRLTLARTGPLKGGTFDLNATPDLLPVMAVLGAYAQGETRLTNAAHARIKETDRIAVMAQELGKLGAAVEERPDGLIIQGRNIHGGRVDGRGDHRVVMALAAAALGASGPVAIQGAESAAITYPGFLDLLAQP